MKVSIIIPFTDNSRETLRWTIQSAQNQTHRDFDIVLVGDGCTDEATIWSARYMAQHQYGTQVILLPEKTGVANARNQGAACAPGSSFLVFLDSDDWIDSTFLSKTLSMVRPDTGIVSTDMHVFSENEDSVVRAYRYTLDELLRINQIPNTSLISRRAFDQAGGYKKEVYEDWNLWIDILSRNWTTEYVPEPLLHYRKRSSGSHITELKTKHEELVENMKKLHPELYYGNLR